MYSARLPMNDSNREKYYAEMELRKYKKDAICAANQLRYGREVIHKIKEAKTSTEISQIMNSARNTYL